VLKRRKGLIIGEGRNIWRQVHVQDLSDIYCLLGDAAAASGGKAAWNETGYYLAENGPFVRGNIQREVARVAYEKKLIPSPEVEPLSDAQVMEMDQFALYALGLRLQIHNERNQLYQTRLRRRPSQQLARTQVIGIGLGQQS
jgi:hypothetical protein